tara:strand:+ start:230 stop:412 length:183 start_codon:yes stop_codon:yes gene_type:complete
VCHFVTPVFLFTFIRFDPEPAYGCWSYPERLFEKRDQETKVPEIKINTIGTFFCTTRLKR